MVRLNPFGRAFWLAAIVVCANLGAVLWAHVRAQVPRMRPLPHWQAVASIIYNPAFSAAAKNSFLAN